ncbi:unnamed protein product [Cladocopium goreaui]|uniref:Uncharacterized protein n=1 Tax=Cladocopium goreaui TaxID=2562237 RepID=A0A9P1FQM6_9DINO|nr:unnamed protein product [Cladocopium goreaui]
MHTLFLGTCRDLHASTLGYWLRTGLLGVEGDWNQQLRQISFMLKQDCRRAGIRVTFKTFTMSNTGLDTQSQFPELGSAFKAAFIKSSCWWFAQKATEIANSRPDES